MLVYSHSASNIISLHCCSSSCDPSLTAFSWCQLASSLRRLCALHYGLICDTLTRTTQLWRMCVTIIIAKIFYFQAHNALSLTCTCQIRVWNWMCQKNLINRLASSVCVLVVFFEWIFEAWTCYQNWFDSISGLHVWTMRIRFRRQVPLALKNDSNRCSKDLFSYGTEFATYINQIWATYMYSVHYLLFFGICE